METPGQPRPGRLAMLPLMGVMRLAGRLGFSKQVMLLMAAQMNSPRRQRRAFAGYQPTDHDVIVATFAKSGTNWTMQIACQIAYYGQADFQHIHDIVPWPEAPMPGIVPLADTTAQEASPSGLRVIKTHMESDFVPYSPLAKYIIVVRDPKDVFVSAYHFGGSFLTGGEGIPVADMLDLTLRDRSPFGSWVAHVASYWPWRERENVLILNYSDMKANLTDAVARIAVLMGVHLRAEELALVVEKSSFPYMKAHEHLFAPPGPFRFFKDGPVLIRRGEQGGAGELLTPQQQAQIDRHALQGLARLGCDVPYAQMFPLAAPDTAAPQKAV